MDIYIVYCTDNNFALVCMTSMVSVLENKEDETIHFYVIDNKITSENKLKIKTMVSQYSNATINFVAFPNLEKIFSTSIKYNNRHVSISTFGRLFISLVLPQNIARVIYLDCDTIVLRSLKGLYKCDLKNKIIAGVDDCKSIKYRWVLGLPEEAPYINGGVLLIDMDKWRENMCENQMIDYLEKHKGRVHFEDQGTLNAVLSKQICLLPMRYNVMTHNYDLTYEELCKFRKPVVKYSKEEVESSKNNPIIIHYTSDFLTEARVWETSTKHKKRILI